MDDGPQRFDQSRLRIFVLRGIYMTKRRSSLTLRTFFCVAFLCISFLYCSGTEDEFLCSEASMHIDSCCGHSVSIDCNEGSYKVYMKDEYGCEYGSPKVVVYRTTLSQDSSRCIIDKGCNEIRDSGICALSPLMVTQQCPGPGQTISPITQAECQAFTKLSCPH